MVKRLVLTGGGMVFAMMMEVEAEAQLGGAVRQVIVATAADWDSNRAVWPYVQVGKWDAYVDDSSSPYYNRHVRVRPDQVPPWFEKQRMRLGDAAYKWMLEIRHNQNPAVPGGGSAIFFHVRRGPDKPSAGCTTMAVEHLEWMIRWLRPEDSPHYVLLPRAEYGALREGWRLP